LLIFFVFFINIRKIGADCSVSQDQDMFGYCARTTYSSGPGSNSYWFSPFYVNINIRVDTLGCWISSLGANPQSLMIALYSINSDSFHLLAYERIVNYNTTGFKEINLTNPVTITEGNYTIAIQSSSGNALLGAQGSGTVYSANGNYNNPPPTNITLTGFTSNFLDVYLKGYVVPITTGEVTSGEMTSASLTTSELTTMEFLTTNELTSLRLTTSEVTTQPLTTTKITTSYFTTNNIKTTGAIITTSLIPSGLNKTSNEILNSQDNNPNLLNVGQIVGIVIGIFVCLLLTVILILLIKKRNTRDKKDTDIQLDNRK